MAIAIPFVVSKSHPKYLTKLIYGIVIAIKVHNVVAKLGILLLVFYGAKSVYLVLDR